MALDLTKPATNQSVGPAIEATRENIVALNAQHQAHAADTTAHGLSAVAAKLADYDTHKANTADAHGLAAVKTSLTAVTSEVTAGRGSKPSLSTRLAVALNDDGSIKLESLTDVWLDGNLVPTYISSTSFSIPTDVSGLFPPGLVIKLTGSGSPAYSVVQSAVFSGGVTTVTLAASHPNNTNTMTKVRLGVISFDAAIAASVAQAQADLLALTATVASLKVLDITVTQEAAPTANQVIARYLATRAFTLPAGLAGSQAKAGVAATGTPVFTWQKNGVAFATYTWAAAGTVPTVNAAAPTAVAVGDVLTLVAPAVPDATLAKFAANLKGAL